MGGIIQTDPQQTQQLQNTNQQVQQNTQQNTAQTTAQQIEQNQANSYNNQSNTLTGQNTNTAYGQNSATTNYLNGYNNQQSSFQTQANPLAMALGSNILNGAQVIGAPGYVPLQQIAGLNPWQQQVLGAVYGQGNALSGLTGIGAQYLGEGANIIGGAAQPLSGADVQGFYNPMADNVSRQMMNIFGQQDIANRVGATAKTGGVGGDRAAVAQALLSNQQGLAAGQTYADLYQRALAAAQQQKQQQLSAGNALANLGPTAIGIGAGGLQAAYGAATVPQQLEQMINQARYQQAMGQYQDPFLRLQAQNQALAGLTGLGQSGVSATQGLFGQVGGGTQVGTGYSNMTGSGYTNTGQSGQSIGQQLGTQNTTQTGSLNGLMTGSQLGTGTGTNQYPAPSLFSQLAGAGTAALGGLGLYNAFSDREDKTDIKKLGQDKASGLPMYAFRYKGDPKSYPKVVGPMAQDVAKANPYAVGEVGGHLAIKGYDGGGSVGDEYDYGGDSASEEGHEPTGIPVQAEGLDSSERALGEGSDDYLPGQGDQQSVLKKYLKRLDAKKAAESLATMQKGFRQASAEGHPKVEPIKMPGFAMPEAKFTMPAWPTAMSIPPKSYQDGGAVDTGPGIIYEPGSSGIDQSTLPPPPDNFLGYPSGGVWPESWLHDPVNLAAIQGNYIGWGQPQDPQPAVDNTTISDGTASTIPVVPTNTPTTNAADAVTNATAATNALAQLPGAPGSPGGWTPGQPTPAFQTPLTLPPMPPPTAWQIPDWQIPQLSAPPPAGQGGPGFPGPGSDMPVTSGGSLPVPVYQQPQQPPPATSGSSGGDATGGGSLPVPVGSGISLIPYKPYVPQLAPYGQSITQQSLLALAQALNQNGPPVYPDVPNLPHYQMGGAVEDAGMGGDPSAVPPPTDWSLQGLGGPGGGTTLGDYYNVSPGDEAWRPEMAFAVAGQPQSQATRQNILGQENDYNTAQGMDWLNETVGDTMNVQPGDKDWTPSLQNPRYFTAMTLFGPRQIDQTAINESLHPTADDPSFSYTGYRRGGPGQPAIIYSSPGWSGGEAFGGYPGDTQGYERLFGATSARGGRLQAGGAAPQANQSSWNTHAAPQAAPPPHTTSFTGTGPPPWAQQGGQSNGQPAGTAQAAGQAAGSQGQGWQAKAGDSGWTPGSGRPPWSYGSDRPGLTAAIPSPAEPTVPTEAAPLPPNFVGAAPGSAPGMPAPPGGWTGWEVPYGTPLQLGGAATSWGNSDRSGSGGGQATTNGGGGFGQGQTSDRGWRARAGDSGWTPGSGKPPWAGGGGRDRPAAAATQPSPETAVAAVAATPAATPTTPAFGSQNIGPAFGLIPYQPGGPTAVSQYNQPLTAQTMLDFAKHLNSGVQTPMFQQGGKIGLPKIKAPKLPKIGLAKHLPFPALHLQGGGLVKTPEENIDFPWGDPNREHEPTGMPESLGYRRQLLADNMSRKDAERLFRTVAAEDPKDPVAHMESVFNRADARDQKVGDAASDSNYYPESTIASKDQPDYSQALDEVLGGSNKTKYATGNASQNVGFGYGRGANDPITYRSPASGERYSIEKPDQGWAESELLQQGERPSMVVGRGTGFAAAEGPPRGGFGPPDTPQGSFAERMKGAAASPWLAVLKAGLGMMAASGERDRHGLPLPGIAAIGKGAIQGVDTLQEQEKSAREERKLNLEEKMKMMPYNELTAVQKIEAMKPVQVGVDDYGYPIYAKRNPTTGQYEEIRNKQSQAASVSPITKNETSGNYVVNGKELVPGKNVAEGVHPEVLAGHEGVADTVLAVAEGRQNPATVPYRQRAMILGLVNKYDPSWDQSVWNLRNKTNGDWAPNGIAGKTMTSFNFAGRHMAELGELTKGLNENQIRTINSTKNWIKTQFSDPQIEKWRNQALIVATEVPKNLRGAGVLNQQEEERWNDRLLNSPKAETYLAGLGQVGHALSVRNDETAQQYKDIMKKDPPYVLSEGAKKAFEQMDQWRTGNFGTKAKAETSKAESSKAEGGDYVYTTYGGKKMRKLKSAPNTKENWEEVPGG